MQLASEPQWHLQFSNQGYPVYRSTRAVNGVKKKSLFSQFRYEKVTFAGVVYKREKERESTDMDQQAGDVSDIQMYIWR